MDLREQAKNYFLNLQDEICQAFIPHHKENFQEDLWQRPGGGGGRTRVFSEGALFEKAGVNFSEVYGEFKEEFAKTMPLGDGTKFYATGISLVLHPVNPYVPTTHANFRYIQRGNTGWFGGGADLTPYYPFLEDVVHFHSTYKKALDPFGEELYPQFKKKCDEYFYLEHRKEMRGVGGIFFDYQTGDYEKIFSMVKACGDQFVNSYLPIVEKRNSMKYTEDHKEFQEVRRGRYVEFNLLYDRGTIFGLKTDGRVESILMSLPLKTRWVYDHKVGKDSEEAKLFPFLQARDYV